MCRMLGMMCNDADLLSCSIREVAKSLLMDESNGHDGVGIGYYASDDPLLKRRPSNPEEQIDHSELVSGIQSNALMTHVRKATVGAWRSENTHPFRFRRWLFAHVGHLPAFESQRDKILEDLPGFLGRSVKGETDSELAFYLFLKTLFQDGTLNNLDLSAQELQDYLRRFHQQLSNLHESSRQKPTIAMLVTNGQIMGALCQGVTMHYSMREGIHDCQEHDQSEQQQQQSHAQFKGIMLGASMSDPGHQWREIGDSSLITISKELELKVSQI